jgi:hypothetical protein
MPVSLPKAARNLGVAFVLATLPIGLHAADLSRSLASPTAWSGAQDVAIYALGLTGVNYKFGGSSPASGLDCSGFVRHVFQEVTGMNLPRTSKEMSALGAKVGAGDLMPGDLVFFNTRRAAYSHVGIYLGDNRFVHAPSQGSEVAIAQMSQSHWQKRFDGARRVLGVLPGLAPGVMPLTIAGDLAADVSWARLPALAPADATP